MTSTICYVGSNLPKRSETFVYRELFGLRDAGLSVLAATVHPPERSLGETRLDKLADEAIPVYGSGFRQLILDATRACMRSPYRAIVTAAQSLHDAISECLRTGPRAAGKILIQSIAGLALAERLHGRGVTHLHAHMAHVPTTIAMFAASMLSCSFSFTGHAADLFRDRSLLPEKLRRARFVSCISNWHRQFYQEICARPDCDYPVIRCGVPLGETSSPNAPDPQGVFRILSLGRMVHKKGFDLLIQASELLSKRGLGVRLTIAGDGPEWEALRTLAKTTTIAKDIHFAGPVDNKAVPALLAESDCFVLACRTAIDGDRDGIPVVLMEAMAAGVPIISGDLPSIRELIQDGVNGKLVLAEDVAAIASAMEAIAKDAAYSQALAQTARTTVESEFSISVNTQRLSSIYQGMES
jgi:glycosyltransferase involved in cell wall biosynthesis